MLFEQNFDFWPSVRRALLALLFRLICHDIAPSSPCCQLCSFAAQPFYATYNCWCCSWPRATVLRCARAPWLGLSALVVLPRLPPRALPRTPTPPVTPDAAPGHWAARAATMYCSYSWGRWGHWGHGLKIQVSNARGFVHHQHWFFVAFSRGFFSSEIEKLD